MVLLLLVFLPAVLGVVAFFMKSLDLKLWLLVAGGAAHVGLTVAAWVASPRSTLGLALDPLGLVFLSVASVLFFCCALYSIAYLPAELLGHSQATGRYVPSLFFFLASMSLTAESQHLGLLWVAIEATTLASAPLVAFQRTAGALEAMWKYLLLCSVGIALSLLGTFFLGLAFAHRPAAEQGLLLPSLLASARDADPAWLRTAFLVAVVGYGTKMGLAPLHSWLPDAHSEAPSPVSALLSGALLNCAFLGILRFFELMVAAGIESMAREVMLTFGLVSLAVATGSILAQRDYKRLLAYSSVENMGILALGIGIGGAASYGSLLHAINHSLAKGMLFLTAGNVFLAYRTKLAAGVRGLANDLPASGALLLAALIAIGGLPPFGLFQSELVILKEAVSSGRIALAFGFFGLAVIGFIGMAALFLPMIHGVGTRAVARDQREQWLLVAPPFGLGAALLALGVYMPPALDRVLHAGAALLGG